MCAWAMTWATRATSGGINCTAWRAIARASGRHTGGGIPTTPPVPIHALPRLRPPRHEPNGYGVRLTTTADNVAFSTGTGGRPTPSVPRVRLWCWRAF